MQRGFIYAQRGNAEIVYAYAKRVLSMHERVMQIWSILVQEDLSMYKRIIPRPSIPMQRGFIHARGGNAETHYPYAKRSYPYTRGYR
jgi:hypothetical protein